MGLMSIKMNGKILTTASLPSLARSNTAKPNEPIETQPQQESKQSTTTSQELIQSTVAPQEPLQPTSASQEDKEYYEAVNPELQNYYNDSLQFGFDRVKKGLFFCFSCNKTNFLSAMRRSESRFNKEDACRQKFTLLKADTFSFRCNVCLCVFRDY